MRDRNRSMIAALGVVFALGVAACSGGGATTAPASVAPATAAPTEAPASEAPASPTEAALACDAKSVGIVTRCENFYTDYWPKIDEALKAVYEEAKATNGGTIVIWDWYELDKSVIDAFTAKYPGLTIKTQGFQQNLSSAIVTAHETGTEGPDYISGSLTSATPLYDGGYFAKVDWTQYGIPAEYLNVGPSEMVPDSLNSWLLNVNTPKAANAPTTYDGLLDPAWKDKLVMASYNGQFFTGYGMVNGKDAMQKLIGDLKGGNLTLSDNPDDLLSTGDKPVMLGGQSYSDNPDISLVPVKDAGTWIQFGGVSAFGKNAAGATLYAIWNAYDPDWITARLSDPNFAYSSVPFPGLPTEFLGQATGLMKLNSDAMYAAAEGAQWETKDNRDQWNELIKAADEIMYQ